MHRHRQPITVSPYLPTLVVLNPQTKAFVASLSDLDSFFTATIHSTGSGDDVASDVRILSSSPKPVKGCVGSRKARQGPARMVAGLV